MTKECKFNNFTVRFFGQSEPATEIRNMYDLCIYEEGLFLRELIFFSSKSQLVFNCNEHLIELGNTEKIIVVRNGASLNLLWTSAKGKNELYDMRGGKMQLFDYLFLNFASKGQKSLYIGNSYESPLAAWRNECSCDIIYSCRPDAIIDEFIKKSSETYLPF